MVAGIGRAAGAIKSSKATPGLSKDALGMGAKSAQSSQASVIREELDLFQKTLFFEFKGLLETFQEQQHKDLVDTMQRLLGRGKSRGSQERQNGKVFEEPAGCAEKLPQELAAIPIWTDGPPPIQPPLEATDGLFMVVESNEGLAVALDNDKHLPLPQKDRVVHEQPVSQVHVPPVTICQEVDNNSHSLKVFDPQGPAQETLNQPVRELAENNVAHQEGKCEQSTASYGSYDECAEGKGQEVKLKQAGLVNVAERSVMDDAPYDVSMFYKEDGLAQRIARSETFLHLTLGLVALNAVFIGVEADNNLEDDPLKQDWPYQLCDQLFCFLFTSEILIRFAAFKRKLNCVRDGWFKFDAVLVSLMVAETWILLLIQLLTGGSLSLPTGPLRLVRLLRLSRMARILRWFPELTILLKGMKLAFRAVNSALAMVLIFIYTFSIIVHMLLKNEPDEKIALQFRSVPLCMWTLLIDGTFLDSPGTTLTRLIHLEKISGFVAIVAFMLFIFLSAMTVLNMLIGVLCEVVSAVGHNEREDAAIELMRNGVLHMLRKFDKDGSGTISKAELQSVMVDPGAIGVLRALKVDIGYLRHFQGMLYKKKHSEVTIEGIIDIMMMCRGDLPVTVQHLAHAMELSRFDTEHRIEKLEDSMLETFG